MLLPRKILTIGLAPFLIGWIFMGISNSLAVDDSESDVKAFFDVFEPKESIERQMIWKQNLVEIRFDPKPSTGTLLLVIQDKGGEVLFSKTQSGFFKQHIEPEPGLTHTVTLTNIGGRTCESQRKYLRNSL